MSETLVGNTRQKRLSKTLVGNTCRKHSLETLVRNTCRKHSLETLIGNTEILVIYTCWKHVGNTRLKCLSETLFPKHFTETLIGSTYQTPSFGNSNWKPLHETLIWNFKTVGTLFNRVCHDTSNLFSCSWFQVCISILWLMTKQPICGYRSVNFEMSLFKLTKKTTKFM